jgi:hypothetical protein
MKFKKYRILKQTTGGSAVEYFAQYKFWLFWKYYKTYYGTIAGDSCNASFNTKEEAHDYIIKQHNDKFTKKFKLKNDIKVVDEFEFVI